MLPPVGRPALKPTTSPDERKLSGRYCASVLRHSPPNVKPAGPPQSSNRSPVTDAEATCSVASVVLVALMRIAVAQASLTFDPNTLQTGAAPPAESCDACSRLRESALNSSSVV